MATSATITNSQGGKIYGGTGGSGAAGGDGVVGYGLTITNSGTITAGAGGAGGTAGDAIDFTGGSNSLTLGSGATTGTLNGTIAVGGTVEIDPGTAAGVNVTLGNLIVDDPSTAGSVTKVGAGTLTLSAANTYSGSTTIAAGVLAGGAANALSGASAVTDDATLDLGGFNQTIGALSGTGTVTDTGAAATLTTGGLNASPTFAGAIQDGTGATSLTKVGNGTLTLSGASTYTGATTIDAGTLQTGVVDAIAASSGVTINAGTFDLDSNDQSIGSLAGAAGTTVSLGSATLTTATAGTIYGGAITGTGGLTVSGGNGSLQLTGTSTYSGATTLSDTSSGFAYLGITGSIVDSNRIQITANTSIAKFVVFNGDGISKTASVTLSGSAEAIFFLDQSTQIGSLNSASATSEIQFASGTTLTTGTNDTNDTFAGTIGPSGSAGALTKIGTGTFTLTGTNDYTGATTISAGTLQLGAGGATGSIADSASIADNGTLAVDETGTVTLNQVVSGSGALTQAGTGTTTLSGDNTYTGGTTISGGALSISADDNLGGAANGMLTLSGGTLETTATLTSQRSVNIGTGGGTVQVYSGTTTLSGAVFGGNLTKTGTGTLVLGAHNGENGTTVDAGTLDLATNDAGGNGAITFAGTQGTPATLMLASAAQPKSGTTFQNTLGDFGANDSLDLTGLTYAGGATTAETFTSSGTGTGTLSVTEDGKTEDFNLTGVPTGTSYYAHADSQGDTLINTVCFCAGTRIRVARDGGTAEVAVEDLAVGDLVVTASGQARPIRWLGHRAIDCRRHPRPREALPVSVVAHAFGENRPARDLFLSPGHSVCVDIVGGVLIPIGRLVNGATIAQLDVDTVTYWHVELDSHDILLAENLACESYIDCGTRAFFAESGVVALGASPDASVLTTDDYCRPFKPEGALVDMVRERLCLRASDLGWRLAVEDELAGLWLEVDGVRVEPARHGLLARVTLPAGAREVRIRSDSAVPATIHGDKDERRLGLRLAGLTIDDGLGCRREIACTDARLKDGFHPHEGTHRWTDGDARLPAELWEGCRGDFHLRLAFAGPALPRWRSPTRTSPSLAAIA